MTNQQEGIFINGKAQVIEMLKLLSKQERDRILKLVRIKNPSLADELTRTCLSFRDIESIDVNLFKYVFRDIRAEILGLALRNSSETFQRKILSEAPRDYAEKAFTMMTGTLSESSRKSVTRAQEVIIRKISTLIVNN